MTKVRRRRILQRRERKQQRRNVLLYCCTSRCIIPIAIFLWVLLLTIGAYIILFPIINNNQIASIHRGSSSMTSKYHEGSLPSIQQLNLRRNNNIIPHHHHQQQQQQPHTPGLPGNWQGISTNNKKMESPPRQQHRQQLSSWMYDSRLSKGMLHKNLMNGVVEECDHFQHDMKQPNHGCEMNDDTQIVSCIFQNLRIDVSKVISYEGGGESLERPGVMGRSEEKEIPKYEYGAFQTPIKPNNIDTLLLNNNSNQKLRYVADILHSLEYYDVPSITKDIKNSSHDCTETWSGTTMFITRYEYANLYHTLTDWWNAYFSLPLTMRDGTDNEKEKIQIVFLDAHAYSTLDDVWERLIGGGNTKPRFVKHLPKGGVCFEKAILIPVGYRAEIFPPRDNIVIGERRRQNCPNKTLANEFSNYMLRSYGLLPDDEQRHQVEKGSIVIIDRQPYLAHPRSIVDEGKRMIENLVDLQHTLQDLEGVSSVQLVRFETMSFEEQLRTIRQTQLLIGNHGAGLSHIMFMDPYTQIVLELNPVREFFIYLSEWEGIRYESLETSKLPWLTSEDLDAITRIVSRLV